MIGSSVRAIAEFVRRHRVLSAVVVCIIAAAAFAVFLAANAPDTSGVRVAACLEADGECIQFPTVDGTNLNGQAFVLPVDFTGDINLVIVSFEEAQTVRAASWLPLARELAVAKPAFAYYSVPVLPSVNLLLRGVISGGMLLLIPDPDVRDVTIMLFLDDIDVFLRALAIPNRDTIQAFLVSDAGSILWRASGEYTNGSGAALRTAVEDAAVP